MSKKIYKRICNTCGKYYEGTGEFFCCRGCVQFPKKRKKQISKRMKGNTHGFKKGQTSWNKGISYPQIKGNKNGNWKGGKFQDARNNRWVIYKPNHPFTRKNGYILQSRLVMEKIIGRYLNPKEVVHHINFNKSNDRPRNLQLFSSQAKHLRFHRLSRKVR